MLVEAYLSGREFTVGVAGGGPAGAFAFSAVERALGAGEKIFTSMDVKPITGDRCRALDPASPVARELFALARTCYEALSLGALVRLDVRADGEGRLCILEANPKPDLTPPAPDKTSLIAAGLPAIGWGYDDLIHYLLIECLWQLAARRPYLVARFLPAALVSDPSRLLALLPARVAAAALGEAGGDSSSGDDDEAAAAGAAAACIDTDAVVVDGDEDGADGVAALRTPSLRTPSLLSFAHTDLPRLAQRTALLSLTDGAGTGATGAGAAPRRRSGGGGGSFTTPPARPGSFTAACAAGAMVIGGGLAPATSPEPAAK